MRKNNRKEKPLNQKYFYAVYMKTNFIQFEIGKSSEANKNFHIFIDDFSIVHIYYINW